MSPRALHLNITFYLQRECNVPNAYQLTVFFFILCVRITPFFYLASLSLSIIPIHTYHIIILLFILVYQIIMSSVVIYRHFPITFLYFYITFCCRSSLSSTYIVHAHYKIGVLIVVCLDFTCNWVSTFRYACW